MSFMPTYASVLPFVCSYDRFSPFGCPCCKLITFFFSCYIVPHGLLISLIALVASLPCTRGRFFLLSPTVPAYPRSRLPPLTENATNVLYTLVFSITVGEPVCPWFRCFLPYLSSYAWLFAPFSFPSWCLLSLARTGSFSFLYRRFFCRDDLSAAL